MYIYVKQDTAGDTPLYMQHLRALESLQVLIDNLLVRNHFIILVIM